MNQKIIEWEEIQQVSWDETSPSGQLNLTGLNIFLQRAAVEHAEHLGFGFQVMSKQNFSWVLIRINIEIKRLPNWHEKVKLVTWPREMARLSAFREFVLYSEKSDEVLCNASSEWLLIDLDSRRPQKMDNHRQFEKFTSTKEALTQSVPKVNKNQTFSDLFAIKPRYSSLDMNGHTNARKYIDWLDDALYEVHGQKKLAFLHMSYYHECKYGEELIIQVGTEDDSVIRGWMPLKEQVAFIASATFK